MSSKAYKYQQNNSKMSALEFFIQGLKDIRTVGTISRSSQFVSKTMIKHVDFNTAKCIVELGAGDGPITKYILRALKGETKVLAFEVNDKLCQLMRDRYDDPRLQVVEDSAEKIQEYVNGAGFEQADYIISALPFVSLPDDLGDRILQEAFKALRPGGKFIQLNYSLIPRKRYEAIFGKSKVNFVTLNIPPAWVIVCEK